MIPLQLLSPLFSFFFFLLPRLLSGSNFQVTPGGSVSHTQRYCNNGGASIVLGRDALECSASVCSAVWEETQFKTHHVCLSWPGPPYVLRPCPPFLRQRGDAERWRTVGQHEGRKGNIDFFKGDNIVRDWFYTRFYHLLNPAEVSNKLSPPLPAQC